MSRAAQELERQLRAMREQAKKPRRQSVEDDDIGAVFDIGEADLQPTTTSEAVTSKATEENGEMAKKATKKRAATKPAKAKKATAKKATTKKREAVDSTTRPTYAAAGDIKPSMAPTAIDAHGTRYVRLAFGEKSVLLCAMNLPPKETVAMRDALLAWLQKQVAVNG